MTTSELIRALRGMATESRFAHDEVTLMQAADRLEELEERVAIMRENEVQVTMDYILRGGL